MYDIAPLWREVVSKTPLLGLLEMKQCLEMVERKAPVIQSAISYIDKEILKRDTRECVKVKADDIKIFPCFEEHPPKTEKMEQKRAYFRETGLLQSQIILDSENNLIDGYTSYLLARENDMEYVPIRYGKRQIVRAYHKQGSRLYAWELPGLLIDRVSVGDKLIVPTQRGVRAVTVAAVEEYRPEEYPEPLRTVIRRKKKVRVA